MTNHVLPQQLRMPGRLKGALAILVFQALANGFIGYLVIDAVSTDESHGRSVPNGGLLYFIGYFSVAVGVILLMSAILTPSRYAWIRYTVVVLEAIGIVSSVINLVAGQLTAIPAAAICIGVIAMFNRDDVRDWFSR